MKIENVAVISLEDYTEYLELKKEKQPVKHKIEGCLMEDCNDFNYEQVFDVRDYHSYELITRNYGDMDVFKAIDSDGECLIFFGKWVD